MNHYWLIGVAIFVGIIVFLSILWKLAVRSTKGGSTGDGSDGTWLFSDGDGDGGGGGD